MGEMLPEFWSPRGDEGDSGREVKGRRSCKVTDIFTWLQCFGAYVSVRAPTAPHLIPELMAYMATIVRVSQDFSGLAWVCYDAAFRRQAALTRNERWFVINSTLYTMCFTGMASATKRCELCFASTHTEQHQGGPGSRDERPAESDRSCRASYDYNKQDQVPAADKAVGGTMPQMEYIVLDAATPMYVLAVGRITLPPGAPCVHTHAGQDRAYGILTGKQFPSSSKPYQMP